jgi:hypothetical protein
MEPKIVKIGRHFINLSNLSWATIHPSRDGKMERIELVFDSKESAFNLYAEEAAEIFLYLDPIAKLELDKL